MQTQFRPYSMFIGPITTTDATSVTLRDTGGNPLKCNYISVECSGGSNDWFTARIYPSNLITPSAGQSTAAQGRGVTTSGIVGGYSGSRGGYPVEFILADTDRTDTVDIQMGTALAAAWFFITYGQIQAGNIMRDNERPAGV